MEGDALVKQMTGAQVMAMAEDVPALVAQNDRASLSPMDLVAVLTKVVQAQQAHLAAQHARLATLEEQLARLNPAPTFEAIKRE